jgi:hypothetical protein
MAFVELRPGSAVAQAVSESKEPARGTDSGVASGVAQRWPRPVVDTSPAGIAALWRKIIRDADAQAPPGPGRMTRALYAGQWDRIYVGLGRGPTEEDELAYPGYQRLLLPLSIPVGDAELTYCTENIETVEFAQFTEDNPGVTHLLVFDRFEKGIDRFLGPLQFLNPRDDTRAGDSMMVGPGKVSFGMAAAMEDAAQTEAVIKSLPAEWIHHPVALKLRGESPAEEEIQ